MTTSTTILIFIGIGAVTANLMKLISWLDQPSSVHSRRIAAH